MNTLCSRELTQVPLLAHLTTDELADAVRACRECRVRSGEVIFDEGTPCTGLHIVKTGRVKLLRLGKQREQMLALVNEREPLDLVPFLDNGGHTCTAQAHGPVVSYFFDYDFAHELIWNTPALLSGVLAAVGSQLRDLCTLASDLAFKDVTTRVCEGLLNLAQSEGEQQANGIHLKRTLSQSEFAALVGTRREVAWRSLKRLEEEGLIQIDRHEIVLLEPERMARRV